MWFLISKVFIIFTRFDGQNITKLACQSDTRFQKFLSFFVVQGQIPILIKCDNRTRTDFPPWGHRINIACWFIINSMIIGLKL